MQQWGICWLAALECDQCTFVSDSQNLQTKCREGGGGGLDKKQLHQM